MSTEDDEGVALPTDEEIDARIRAAWGDAPNLLPAWKSPTVYIGPWVRVVYLQALVDGYKLAVQHVKEH